MVIPVSFDWVKAKASCSLKAIFASLREVVDSDVKTACSLLGVPGDVRFTANSPAENKIIIHRIVDMGGFEDVCSVVFELTQSEIKVRQTMPRPEKELFSARPFLNPEGKCMLQVGQDDPIELWQLSRKALEDLFFAVKG